MTKGKFAAKADRARQRHETETITALRTELIAAKAERTDLIREVERLRSEVSRLRVLDEKFQEAVDSVVELRSAKADDTVRRMSIALRLIGEGFAAADLEPKFDNEHWDALRRELGPELWQDFIRPVSNRDTRRAMVHRSPGANREDVKLAHKKGLMV